MTGATALKFPVAAGSQELAKSERTLLLNRFLKHAISFDRFSFGRIELSPSPRICALLRRYPYGWHTQVHGYACEFSLIYEKWESTVRTSATKQELRDCLRLRQCVNERS